MVPYKDGGMNQHNITVPHFLYFAIKASAHRNIYRHERHPRYARFLFLIFFLGLIPLLWLAGAENRKR